MKEKYKKEFTTDPIFVVLHAATTAILLILAFVLMHATGALYHGWGQAVMVGLLAIGIVNYFGERMVRKNGKLKYFAAFRAGVLMTSLAFFLFGLFLFGYLNLVPAAPEIEGVPIAAASVGAMLGGSFLGVILVFVLLPLFKEKVR